MPEQIDIKINGRTVKACDRETLISVCDREGIHIPTLCWDEDLEPYGGCRLCIVHVEGLLGRNRSTQWMFPLPIRMRHQNRQRGISSPVRV
mgnify:CR=1 FL=1